MPPDELKTRTHTIDMPPKPPSCRSISVSVRGILSRPGRGPCLRYSLGPAPRSLLLIALLAFASSLHAQTTYNWDANRGGAGTGGTGSWSTGAFGASAYTLSGLTAVNEGAWQLDDTAGINTIDDDIRMHSGACLLISRNMQVDNGVNWDWNQTIANTFTITAIPEPSTYAAAAALVGLMLWPSRRRIIRDTKKILGLTLPMRARFAARLEQKMKPKA